MIRPITSGDLKKVVEFHNKFSSHELDFDRVLYHGVEEVGDKIIVYGAVKEFNELVISVNKDAPLKDRVRGIEDLLHTCVYLAGTKGQNKLFAFAQPDFSLILQKHYGFVELPERILALKVPEVK